jgi:NAD-dependent SIR2 family protein deacetylase
VSLLATDPDTQLAFSVFENPGVFALLLGSGLSRSAGIPTGWEITKDLIRRVALAKDVPEQLDWIVWYRDQTSAAPIYSDLIEELGLSPDERRSILHNYIEPTDQDRLDGKKAPTKAHLAIADLVRAGFIRIIVTTNFDRLLENALRERGIEPTVIASSDALIGAQPIAHSNCYILKLHGDYKDSRILNTDVELGSYPQSYDRLLDRIFDEYGLIIAGWSAEWDQALRGALLRAVNRRYTVYWTSRGKIGDVARDLINHRKAKIIPIVDADTFFAKLQHKIEVLQQSQAQNPFSIELLVNSAKRFLERPEYRIQLDELVSSQVGQLRTLVDAAELNPRGPETAEEFRRRVQIYEAATEPLARIAGVLGRWGDGDELSTLLEIIASLYLWAEKEKSGSSMLSGLRSYPALLMFSAYGLGLTRAQRWPVLHRLFSAELHSDSQSARLIDTLFLWRWKGFQDAWWKYISGLENRKTPFSDHLCSKMEELGSSFLGLTSDFEMLFERFEMLESMAFLENSSEHNLKSKLDSNPQQGRKGGTVWMPIGRVGWDNPRKDRLLKELESPEVSKSLLEAGFAHKSQSFLQLFAINFERVKAQLGWW